MKDLLPIGSVILRKQLPKYAIICGIYQKDENGKYYDYTVAPWPQGMVHTSLLSGCQHEDIVAVVSLGYRDDEEREFREKCLEHMKDTKE